MMNRHYCFTFKVVFFAMTVFLLLHAHFKPSKTDNYLVSCQFKNKCNFNNEEKQFDLRVIVMVYDRAHSLLRLLQSLNDAEYFSDIIKIEVWIDRSDKGIINEATLKTAQNFVFKHGHYDVTLHRYHVGIYGQWLRTWKPKLNSSEIAVFLEDDVTVSKYFWKYLKVVHKTYDKHKDINGYSLQGQQSTFNVESPHILQVPNSSFVYLFPVLGSWGFSPNKRNWKEFIDWFNLQDTSTAMPFVPGHLATKWYKDLIKKGRSNTMWTIWHIYYAWKNNEYTLYCNYPNHAGLAASWRERGLHTLTSIGTSNPLLTEWKTKYENLPKIPTYFDVSGKQMSLEEII